MRETYLKKDSKSQGIASASFRASTESQMFIAKCLFMNDSEDYVPLLWHTGTRDA